MRVIFAAVLCCVWVLSGCTTTGTKGKIERRGVIIISGYEFSDCDRAGNAVTYNTDASVTLCGYSVQDLMQEDGAIFHRLSFSGGNPEVSSVVIDGIIDDVLNISEGGAE